MRNNAHNWMGMVVVGIVCLVIGDIIGLRNGDGMVIGHGDGTETVVGHLRLESPDAPTPSTVETTQTIYRVVTRWEATEYQDAHESRSHEQTLENAAQSCRWSRRRMEPGQTHWVEKVVDPGRPAEFYLGDPAAEEEAADVLDPELHETLDLVLAFAELGLAQADLMKTARATSATLGWIEPEAETQDPFPRGLPITCRIYYDDGSTTSWSLSPPDGVSRDYDYWRITFETREPEPVIQEWIGPEAGLPLPISPDDYTIHFPKGPPPYETIDIKDLDIDTLTDRANHEQIEWGGKPRYGAGYMTCEAYDPDAYPYYMAHAAELERRKAVKGEMPDPGIVMPHDPVPEFPSYIERGFFGSDTMTGAVAEEVERQKAINRAREAGK